MTAADQTPATERVEQIRARWYEHHIDPTDRDARVLLLTEVDVPWLLNQLAEQTAIADAFKAANADLVQYREAELQAVRAALAATEAALSTTIRAVREHAYKIIRGSGMAAIASANAATAVRTAEEFLTVLADPTGVRP